MTNEQALQYAKEAAQQAMAEQPKQHSMRFTLTDSIPSATESGIGGAPYFPAGAEVPQDSCGNPLRFLMQINCKDVQGIDCFPQEGIIQFWIAADDCWGMCDREDKGFRVIYYDSVTAPTAAQPFTAFSEEELEFFPLKGTYGVTFTAETEDVSTHSPAYQQAFCRYFNELSGEQIEQPADLVIKLKLPWEIMDSVIWEDEAIYGHKIGGSSDFCQDDPRHTEAMQNNYDFQLLQLSSDFGRKNGADFTRIMFGDAGICHFFINSEKLKKRDFSDILYYCDCC